MDFRATRRKLPPDAFAVGPDTPWPAPHDLVSRRVWSGIMDLPDHVAVYTSDHNGRLLRMLYRLWAAWIGASGDPNHPDLLFPAMLDALDEYQAATFNALHGFYRQAIGCLRNALEVVAIGSYCQIQQRTDEFERWRAGDEEIAFRKACNELRSAPTVAALDRYLRGMLNDSLSDYQDQQGKVRRLYYTVSNYAHSRPGSTANALWDLSNGPIYVGESLDLVVRLFFETTAVTYVLAKLARPSLQLEPPADQLFGSGRFAQDTLLRTAWARLSQAAHRT